MRRLLVALALAAASGCTSTPAPGGETERFLGAYGKRVGFSLLEDYDKGDDLAGIERDFALMRSLGITTWRGSFGWDDYEPKRGEYDLAWLHAFAEAAARHGIALRPYLAYTPEWAAGGGAADDEAWNDPPADLEAWRAFAGRIAAEMRRHPHVLSFEIYNEENVPQWWDGTAEQYARTLAAAVDTIARANPAAEILMGGIVFPDVEWIEATCAVPGAGDAVDVIPIHAYPETWFPESVTVENYLGALYRDHFLPAMDAACGEKPVWINEAGFATTPGKSERDQAIWWARAIPTFLAAPRVEHIGIYELRDLPTDRPVIGDAPNYYLGLLRRDGTPKLAFHTVRTLVRLLDTGTLVVADSALVITEAAPSGAERYAHLFVRPDGAQVLVAWVRGESATVDLRLPRRGRSATAYALDGTSAPLSGFDGRTLRSVRLEPGDVRIVVITP